jgi:hypothetical protein
MPSERIAGDGSPLDHHRRSADFGVLSNLRSQRVLDRTPPEHRGSPTCCAARTSPGVGRPQRLARRLLSQWTACHERCRHRPRVLTLVDAECTPCAMRRRRSLAARNSRLGHRLASRRTLHRHACSSKPPRHPPTFRARPRFRSGADGMRQIHARLARS